MIKIIPETSSKPEPARRIFSNGLILAVAVFYLLHLQNGHDWGGDFSMYIHHAQNIVSGIPYSQTGYIYNPDTAVYGPQAYPPVFPLILAPFVFFFGINLLVLKIPGILCFTLFLFFLNNRITGRDLSEHYRVLLIGLTGFSPTFFLQSESVLSDIPFLLITSIALYRLDRAFSAEDNASGWKSDLLTGLCVYLSYGTRTIGIILLPIVLLMYLLNRKNHGWSFVVTLGIACALILLQRTLIPGTGSYLDQFSGSLGDFIAILNVLFNNYLTLALKMIPIGNLRVQKIIFFIEFLIILVGFYNRVKMKRSSFEIFFGVYLVALLIWPSFQGYRLLLPILPLIFLYLVEGIFILLKWSRLEAIRNGLGIALTLVAAGGYLVLYRQILPRPISAMEKETTHELFNYVKNETSPEDVFVFFKPRVLALFTGRSALALAVPGTNIDPIERMRQFGVDRVIVYQDYEWEYQPEQIKLIKDHPEDFTLTYSNTDFSVYTFK